MKSRLLFFGVLVLATCLTQLATDIYSPSLPAIAEDLNTSINYVQGSMSIYMLSVSLSLLIYGPLSEGIGRKIPLIIGLVFMVIGSIMCSISADIDLLIIGRFIQGFGAGACSGLWRTIFRDAFSGDDLAKYTSYLVIFIMFIVAAGPIAGGYLQEFFGWQASFIFMTIYSLVALIGIILWLEETNKDYHISKLKLGYIIKHYLVLLRSPIFMGVTCSTFLSYGAFFSWFVIGQVLLIEQIGMGPTAFGWLTFFGCGIPYVLAGYSNGKLVKHYGTVFMMRFGWGIAAFAGLLMLLGYFIAEVNIWVIMLPLALFNFGLTFIWPNAFAEAFTPFGHIAGYAGALYGFMQICGGAALSGLISYLPEKTQLGYAIMLIFCSLTAWLVFEIARKYQS